MKINPYFILALAIVVEVIATSALRASEGFTRLWPSVVVVIGYVLSFYVLSLSLRSIPVGVVYATWSGAGIVLITLCAMFLFKQIPDLAAILGICLIISGVIVLNVFSKMQVH